MGLLFLLLMLVAIFFFVFSKKSGAILALAVLFPEMTGIILNRAGLEGFNMLFRYSLYIVVFVMNIDVLKYGIKRLWGDLTSILFYAVIITMLVLNLFIVGRARYDTDVADFQMNVILRVFVPYVVVLLTLINRKNIMDFCKSIPVWGMMFFGVFFLLIGMGGIVIEDRMTIEEATGIGPIELSRFSGLIIIACTVFLIDSKSRLQPVYIAMILIGLFLLFLSSQRGSILGVAFSVLIVLYYFLARRGRPGTLVIALVFLVIISLILLEQFHFSFLSRFVELEDFEESNRFFDYGFSWAAFSKNHYFWGLGSMGYYYFMDELRSYPHNFVLEQMVEYGIVGLVFAITLLVQGFRSSFRLFRNFNTPGAIKTIPAMWIMMLASVLVSGSFLSNYSFMVLTATLLSADACYKDENEFPKTVIYKRAQL
ncbi:MAG: O-antigen ligase family protein [Bacteroidales bacterium]|nr:O-antigen ligase family protein [Bacteroidales bacterium]